MIPSHKEIYFTHVFPLRSLQRESRSLAWRLVVDLHLLPAGTGQRLCADGWVFTSLVTGEGRTISVAYPLFYRLLKTNNWCSETNALVYFDMNEIVTVYLYVK